LLPDYTVALLGFATLFENMPNALRFSAEADRYFVIKSPDGID